MEKGKIIFAGNWTKIKNFKKTALKYTISLFIVSTPFLLLAVYETLKGVGTFFDRSMLFLYFGAFVGYSTFLSFALLPQNFEIRENGILLPLRRWRDVIMRRERFIEYRDISDIKLGQTPVEHELVLKNGKRIPLGLWGGFFLLYGIANNRVGKLDKTLRAVREELVMQRGGHEDVLIVKENLNL